MNPELAGTPIEAFRPGGLLANAHLQSILTSSPPRRRRVLRRARGYLSRTRREVIHTIDGANLLGFSNQAESARRGALVILLHGWEGSVDSNYLLSAAVALDAAGFDTFRLNFRDHGDSHHLNRDLFHSCRLDEVVNAVAQLADRFGPGPVFLAGFSLGGNFALRVARAASGRGIELTRVFAVSPVVRPAHVLDALESGWWLYHRYFIAKWRRSLRIKQALFADEFDLDGWFALDNLRDQTDWLVRNQTGFSSLDQYLEGYSIAGSYLDGLSVPCLVVSARDDPIIPASDFRTLPAIPALSIELTDHGGHCGFLENWRLDSWIERRMIADFQG